MSFALEVMSVNQKFRSGFWMREYQILNEVSLTVPQGSVMGFIGENGAGKTTLIQLMVGVFTPTSGQIHVFGQPAHSKKAKLKIGYLPERPYFYEHLSGESFLEYVGILAGMTRRLIQERINQVLSQVGLTEARKSKLGHYSKGMLQRIGIAQALLHNPELLILDEPMSGLDPTGRREMRNLLQQLSQEGRTIFFSTHVLPDIETICDHLCLIKKGKVQRSGKVADLVQSRIEVVFTGMERLQAERNPGLFSLEETPSGFKAYVSDSSHLQDSLAWIMREGAVIQAVTPQKVNLDPLFAKELLL